MFHFDFLETGFTVGEIAGLISGSIATLHVFVPLTFAVIAVGFIRNQQYDAVAWSAIAHQLQSTLWPFLLQADSASGNWMFWKGRRVPWRIFFLGVLGLLATLSLIAASFLTPRPLTETKRPSRWTTEASFKYVQDNSFYGQGTLPRPADPVWRTCGALKFMDCPQSIFDNATIRGQYLSRPNSTIVINSTIPDAITDVFTSGTKDTTIANPLDIQFRNWQRWADWYVDNNEVKAQAAFHPLQTFVLVDQYQVVEGLVVDAINGGICFRNHTIPTGLQLGAQWSEDLLCFEPETACTNTNLTLGFRLSTQNYWTSVDGYMRDDGGFADISSSPPEPRWDVDDGSGWRETGPYPNLQDRADKAAWWNNQFTAQVLNVNAPQPGEVYRNNFTGYVLTSAPSSLKIDQMNGDYLDAVDFYRNSQTSLDFQHYGFRCAGYDDTDNITTSKAHIKCGYLYSVPEPTDAENLQMHRFDLGSNWTQQLYTCASSVKASVKTVTFRTTGQETLPDLSIISILPKNYTAETMPYWAIEKANASSYKIEDLQLFWGLIDPSYANHPDIIVRRTPSIYLPATQHGSTLGHMWNGFAAGMVFSAAWESVYDDASVVKGTEEDFMPSYSGDMDYGMNLKWRQLSKTAAGSAKILNLIWTDLVAFSVVGTRTGFEDGSMNTSGLLRRDDEDAVLGTRAVHRNVRVIEYTNIWYAVPAFIAGGLFLFGVMGTLVMACGCIVTRRTMIHYLNQTSMGRIFTQATGEDVNAAWTTEQWIEEVGETPLEIPGPQKKMPKSKRRRSAQIRNASPLTGNGGQDYGLSQRRRRAGGNDYDSLPSPSAAYG